MSFVSGEQGEDEVKMTKEEDSVPPGNWGRTRMLPEPRPGEKETLMVRDAVKSLEMKMSSDLDIVPFLLNIY